MCNSVWEALESALADAFDAMLYPANLQRVGYLIYMAIPDVMTRIDVIEATIPRCLSNDARKSEAAQLLASVRAAAERRNDIVHGRVLRVVGFQLVPNIVAATQIWPNGVAAYQWAAADLIAYIDMFVKLEEEIVALTARILADVSSGKSIDGRLSDSLLHDRRSA